MNNDSGSDYKTHRLGNDFGGGVTQESETDRNDRRKGRRRRKSVH